MMMMKSLLIVDGVFVKMVFESKTSAAMMMSLIEGSDALRDHGATEPGHGQLVRRRKKRRAADAMVKKFGGQ